MNLTLAAGSSKNMQTKKIYLNVSNNGSPASEAFNEFLQRFKGGGQGGGNQRVIVQDVSKPSSASLNSQKPLGLNKNKAHAALKNLQNGP